MNDPSRDETQSYSADGYELLTVEELAHILKVPPSWIYERTRRRGVAQIPHIKLGKYIRFEERKVREYLRQHSTGCCETRRRA
jgi:excisionase family DNA binding protein